MKRQVCVVVCLALLCSVGKAAEPPLKPPPKPLEQQKPIPVKKLARDFQTNEIAAEDRYSDKEFEVCGRVARVITPRSSSPGDTAGGKNAYVVERRIKPCDLSEIVGRWIFDESERESLAKLKPGQRVVIRGRCGHLVIYSYPDIHKKDFLEIPFRDCRIVPGRSPERPARPKRKRDGGR